MTFQSMLNRRIISFFFFALVGRSWLNTVAPRHFTKSLVEALCVGRNSGLVGLEAPRKAWLQCGSTQDAKTIAEDQCRPHQMGGIMRTPERSSPKLSSHTLYFFNSSYVLPGLCGTLTRFECLCVNCFGEVRTCCLFSWFVLFFLVCKCCCFSTLRNPWQSSFQVLA